MAEIIYKYGDQITDAKRTKKVLIIDDKTSLVNLNDESVSPNKVYSDYSRHVWSIIDKTSGTKVYSANVKILSDNGLRTIQKRWEAAYNFLLEAEVKKALTGEGVPASESNSSSACYTLKYRYGSYTGKTPAEVISNNGVEEIQKQIKSLESNLGKFPSNKALIDASKEAISLYNMGELKKIENSASGIFYIFNKDNNMKYFTTEISGGRKKLYSLQIMVDIAKDNPVGVKITNATGKIIKKENGTTQITDIQDVESSVIWMSSTEFDELLDRVYRAMVQTEAMWRPECKKASDNSAKLARLKIK